MRFEFSIKLYALYFGMEGAYGSCERSHGNFMCRRSGCSVKCHGKTATVRCRSDGSLGVRQETACGERSLDMIYRHTHCIDTLTLPLMHAHTHLMTLPRLLAHTIHLYSVGRCDTHICALHTLP